MCDHRPPEPAMVVLQPGVWCDPCIEPLVRVLNTGGLQTIASCCGHGKRPGKIAMADGRELFILPDFDAARRLDTLITEREVDLRSQASGVEPSGGEGQPHA